MNKRNVKSKAFRRSLLLACGLSLFANLQCQLAVQAAPDASAGKDKVLIAANEGGITWHDKYDETLKAADKNRKWVLVDVFTEWCGWCKKLDRDVYENAGVAKYINDSFVCMKADAEKGDGKTVADKFGVHGFPCTLVLDPKGREKGRIDGYMDATAFPKKLSEIIKGK